MKIGVVPARLNSVRLPRKILADLNGKPLIAHVMERALEAKSLDIRKQRIAEILATYSHDIFNNSTLQ